MDQNTFNYFIQLAKKRSDCGPANVDDVVRTVQKIKDIPGDILEAGCYICGMTIAMAASDPNKTIYACDTFGELPYGPGQNGFQNFSQNYDFEEVRNSVSQLPNIVMIKGRHEETIPPLSNKIFRLSLIYMDSDFYSSHKVCLSHLWPLLSKGGYIIFHDWAFTEVQQAIREELEPFHNECDIWDNNVFSGSCNLGVIRKRL